MTDSEQQHIEDGSMMEIERNKQTEKSTQKKPEGLQAVSKYSFQNIDEMRIIDLKDALRARDLATTGNKIELKKRLQEAIMQNHDLNTTVTELRESRITNRECIMVRKEVTDGHETTDDIETSDEDTANKEKRSEHRRRIKRGNGAMLNDKERRRED
ncbi:unnamed protein product [Lasius platythorax]|uniref:SAP domain-containing protein n=1 Tax=Lasius platythorax TaxID=488582 RepID=A0AAV2NM24_9HYME